MAINDEKTKGIGPYSEQCFIKDFMPFFSAIHGKDRSDYDPAAEIPGALVSEPVNILKVDRLKLGASLTRDKKANEGASTFMSKLNSPHGQKLLENVPKELMSNLQPKIRIYKILFDSPESAKKSSNGVEVEFPFNNFSEHESIGPDTMGPPSPHLPNLLAVGLKEFSFDYLGTNPAEVDYYINVGMKLWFNSADAMFHKYPTPALKNNPENTISFADLITRPSWIGESSVAHLAWHPTHFRIRVDVSYSPPAPAFLDEACRELVSLGKSHSELREELLEAIESVKVSFFLNLLKHSFSFRSDVPSTPFEVDIQYVGAVETGLYSQDANILRAKVDTTKIEQLKNKEESPWKGMKIMAEQLIDSTGLDPRDFAESTWFRTEIRGFWEGIRTSATRGDKYHILRKRDAVKDILQSKAGVDANIWPENELQYGSGKINSNDKKKKLKGFGNEFADKLHMFYAYKRSWNSLLLDNGLAANQIRTRMYTRILEELAAKTQIIDSCTRERPSRIYSIDVPSDYIIHWRKKTKHRMLTPAENKKIKEAGQNTRANARKDIEEAKQARFDRVTGEAGPYKLRMQILAEMFRSLRPAAAKIDEEGLVPDAPQVPSEAHLETGWEESINNFVSSKLAENASANDIEKTRKALLPPSTAPTIGANTKITWFYFGDLIDAALDILRDAPVQEALKLDIWNSPYYSPDNTRVGGGGQIKVILGDVTYYDPVAGDKRTISLLDLPISYELFREFWSEKVIKRMVEKYPFQAFLRDAMNELVAAALTNKCAISGEPVAGVRPHIFQASIPGSAKRKVFAARPLGDFAGGTPTKGMRGADRVYRAHIHDIDPAKNLSHDVALMSTIYDLKKVPPGFGSMQMTYDDRINKEDCASSRPQEIIYLCATSDQPLSLLSGNNKAKDIENGILYLEVGTDGTPVENINFQKLDIPGFLESKGERTGIKDNPLELSEPYSCSFTIYGNTMIKPGMYIHIRLPHFGLPSAKKSAARRLGIGGYFFVYKTRNSLILRGNKFDWTTDVNCLWNAYGGEEKDMPLHLMQGTY